MKPQVTLHPNHLKVLHQQRKILAMMGIDVWIQRSSPTVLMDVETDDTLMSVGHSRIQSLEIANSIEIAETSLVDSHSNRPSLETTTSSSNTATILDRSKGINRSNVNALNSNELDSNKGENADTAFTDSTAHSDKLSQDSLGDSESFVSQEQVSPFDLIGVRYHSWVLLVDSKYLKDELIVKLWHNIVQTLSLLPEHLQFPICDGIVDKESADASVAGFIFRLGKREQASVAALTPMPEALDDESFIRVPYLTEMLDDSRQKKQLWQLISESDK